MLILFATQTEIFKRNLAVPKSVLPILGEEMIATPENHSISFMDSRIIIRLSVHFTSENL